jgi:hypothetical protein
MCQHSLENPYFTLIGIKLRSGKDGCRHVLLPKLITCDFWFSFIEIFETAKTFADILV